MPRNRLFLLLLVGLTLVLAGLVLADWLPGLRGPAVGTSEWYWRYGLRPVERWVWAVGAAVVVVGWGWLFVKGGELVGTCPRKAEGRNSGELKRGDLGFGVWDLGVRLGLVGLVVGSLGLQLGLVYAHRPQVAAELVDRTLANESNGYFAVAAETADMGELLRHFPERMPGFASEHTRTHPPGIIVGQWLTIRALAAVPGVADGLADWVRPMRCADLWLLDRPDEVWAALAVWAFLPLLAGALTVGPVYGLGRRVAGEGAGRWAAVLAATLPSLLIFAPTPDQIYALLGVVMVLAWWLAMEKGDGRYAFAAGVVLSLATFLSLGNGALVVVVGVVWLNSQISKTKDQKEKEREKEREEEEEEEARNPKSKIQNLKLIALFLVGLASIWLVYWVGWGVPPWEVARVGVGQHYELVTSQRRYGWWVGYNLLDLLLFAGPVVVGGFVGGVLRGNWGKLPSQGRGQELGGTQEGKVGSWGLALALGLLVVLLDVSGTARGEVGRLWLFLMPLLAVVAGGYVAGLWVTEEGGSRTAPTGWLLLGQLLLALSLGLAWRPIEAVIVVAERPVMAEGRPVNETAVTFGEGIELIGYEVGEAAAGETLAVRLYWRVGGGVERPYTVFVHLVDEAGELVAQQDNWPVQGQWPLTCWQEGERVVDEYELVLPGEMRPGEYGLQIGLYDASDGVRLLTADGEDQVRLAEVVFD